jgi:hypothetical protein
MIETRPTVVRINLAPGNETAREWRFSRSCTVRQWRKAP